MPDMQLQFIGDIAWRSGYHQRQSGVFGATVPLGKEWSSMHSRRSKNGHELAVRFGTISSSTENAYGPKKGGLWDWRGGSWSALRRGAVLSAIFLAACSTSDPGTGIPDTDSPPGDSKNTKTDTGPKVLAPYKDLVFNKIDILDAGSILNRTGLQGKLVRAADGTLFYASLRLLKQLTGQELEKCDIAVFAGGSAPTENYGLRIAVRAPGAATWTIESVNFATVAAPGVPMALFGLDAAFNSGGQLVVTLAAGAGGLFSCGSSDLIMVRRQAANSYTLTTPVADSGACCAPTECVAVVGDSEPACTQGTDVGAWSAVALDPAGSLAIAYVDYHNFADEDGQSWQGYEMWHESGNNVFGIQPWSGYGRFGDLVYSGTTAVSAYAGWTNLGIHIRRRTGSAGNTSDWEDVVLAKTSKVGERLNLAVAPDGRVGLVYHETQTSGTTTNYLYYTESTNDGETWSTAERIDKTGIQIKFPSFAFDAESRPVIAYTTCNDNNQCRANSNGIRMTWRELDGTWPRLPTQVWLPKNELVGDYLQMVLDPDTNIPTFAFHNTTTGSAMYGEGSYP